jgi:hypothetical protein
MVILGLFDYLSQTHSMSSVTYTFDYVTAVAGLVTDHTLQRLCSAISWHPVINSQATVNSLKDIYHRKKCRTLR